MRVRIAAATVTGIATIFALSMSLAPAAAAAPAPAPAGIPCAGVWKLNEQATVRTRSTPGPFVQFFEPWGKNGWMRMNTGELETATSAEWHFEQFNNMPYQVFGSDPSLGKARLITDRIVEATRVREGEEANTQYVIFSENCKRVSLFKAEGEDRHAPPGKQHFYNDLRVFDLVEPPAAPAAAVAAELFGGWELNRAASKLTLGPKEAETLVIVPWGKSGWVWNQLSGGPYQPENLHQRVARIECGATTGTTAVACEGPRPGMNLYWASFDAKTFPTYGSRHAQVQLKRIDARNFEVASFTATQGAAKADRTTVALAADGRRLTVTTKSGANPEDVRIYDRINGDTWPTVMP